MTQPRIPAGQTWGLPPRTDHTVIADVPGIVTASVAWEQIATAAVPAPGSALTTSPRAPARHASGTAHRRAKGHRMSASSSRGITHLATAALAALLVAGCSVQMRTPAATPTPSTSTPVATPTASTSTPAIPSTAAPPSTVVGPLTGEELVLVEGISRLHKTMDKVLVDSPSPLTPATLHSLTQPLYTCHAQLVQLGPPTERLQHVYQLAEQACTDYVTAAKSFDTAASVKTPIAGTGAARKIEEAIHAGFAACEKGSRLFADAAVEGFQIKQAAG
jgi:hypothetical protein